jgi:hypothetical protein
LNAVRSRPVNSGVMRLIRNRIIVMKLARVKFLGIYLIAICSLQICLYFILFLNPKDLRVLLKFDPRYGIFALEAVFRVFLGSAEPVAYSIFSWLTAGWMLTLGILLSFGRPLLKTYIISEIIFSLPSLLLSLAVVVVVLTSGSRFSNYDLFTILIPLSFSIIPLVWAIWLACVHVSEES